ncbi:MAG: hypothetical protein P4M15_00170 [Alphaproteobacteria bacterium]|nr:hypothetical protein [Alphaproteobacteria bacterium]
MTYDGEVYQTYRGKDGVYRIAEPVQEAFQSEAARQTRVFKKADRSMMGWGLGIMAAAAVIGFGVRAESMPLTSEFPDGRDYSDSCMRSKTPNIVTFIERLNPTAPRELNGATCQFTLTFN